MSKCKLVICCRKDELCNGPLAFADEVRAWGHRSWLHAEAVGSFQHFPFLHAQLVEIFAVLHHSLYRFVWEYVQRA